jgi:SAM-dependent methyltransferase
LETCPRFKTSVYNVGHAETIVADKVDLYNRAYGEYDLYAEIRGLTYGEDLGQTSWVTTAESDEIPGLLNVGCESRVLEIGCGSGRYALRVAERTGCQITGIDINANGIETANELARTQGRESRVRFFTHDLANPLPFEASSFDAAFANDVLCHIAGRSQLLQEIHRVLKKSGRLLFSDALVIGGLISFQEIATRSSIGYYMFSPPETNEELVREAGFRVIAVSDTTGNAADIAKRWHDARRQFREKLVIREGEHDFEGLQRFLSCVHELTSERRLLRYVYLAVKGE